LRLNRQEAQLSGILLARVLTVGLFFFAASTGFASSHSSDTPGHGAGRRPSALAQTEVTDTDTPISIALSYQGGGSPEALSFVIRQSPAHGTLSEQSPGVFVYEPNPGFNGNDSFAWRVKDGRRRASRATVNLRVNRIPTANDGSIHTTRDKEVRFTISASDDDLSGPYRVEIVQEPLHGSLTTSSLTQYRYWPDPGYTGADSYQWIVHDGTSVSNVATISIQVREIRSLPEALMLAPPRGDMSRPRLEAAHGIGQVPFRQHDPVQMIGHQHGTHRLPLSGQ